MHEIDLIREILRKILHSDLGRSYDGAGVPETKFKIIAKSSGLICGVKYIPEIVAMLERDFFIKQPHGETYKPVLVTIDEHDGSWVTLSPSGTVIAELYGNGEVSLKAERTICNIIARLSGIATETRRQVQQLEGIKVELYDTRKDISILRELDQYAVEIGGGKSHQISLNDGVIIKGNDIAVYGSVKRAIDIRLAEVRALNLIEVEVNNFDLLDEVLNDGRVKMIMLDNMSPDELRIAVNLIHSVEGKYIIEASGVGSYDLREIAETGVDRISTSSLITRGAGHPLDISMKPA